MITRGHTRLTSAVKLVVVFAILILIVLPIVWMIVTSLRPAGEIGTGIGWPSRWTLKGYVLIGEFGFFRNFANSLVVAVVGSAGSVVLALIAAYAFSRRRFKGRQAMLLAIVMTQLFPFILLVTPLYIVFQRLFLIDTYFGLIISYVAITLPFSVYFLYGYMASIPRDLDEAAELDGCGTLRTLFRVILPVAWPGVVTVAIYSFILTWEEYLLASVLLTSPEKRTLPVALAGLFGEFTTQWDVVMSAAVVATLPTMIIFLVLQRRLAADLVGGAVK